MGPEKRLLFAPQPKYFKLFNVHFLRPFCLIQKLLSALRSEVGWPRTKVVFAENITPLFEKKYFLGGGGPLGPRPLVFVLGLIKGDNPDLNFQSNSATG